MGLRDLVIKEENEDSFLISEKESYEKPQDLIKFQVHGPIKNQYIITSHSFGDLGKTKVLDIFLLDYKRAIETAYSEARKYVKGFCSSGLIHYEDRTSLKDVVLDID